MGGTPTVSPPGRNSRGWGPPCLPPSSPAPSPGEQLKRPNDGDTKGLPGEPLCFCPSSPLSNTLPIFPPPLPLAQKLLTGSQGSFQHPEQGDMMGTHGGPYSRSTPGPVLPPPITVSPWGPPKSLPTAPQ